MFDSVNWSAARVVWELVSALTVIVFTVALWWIRRWSASSAAIRDVNTRIDSVERHIERVEQTVESMPGHSDIERLRVEQAKTNEMLARIEATQRAQNELTGRIHTYLFNERGSR